MHVVRSLLARLRAVAPGAAPIGVPVPLRACLGALCAVVLTGFVSHLWLDGANGLPTLIAPVGASAVLLFAQPASPMAQPRAIFGGNVLSALVGVACAMLIDNLILAGGVAVALAIAAMSRLRCLHPPGGAVALTAVIGGPAIVAASWSFALVPVALNSALLLMIGWLFRQFYRFRKIAPPHVVQTYGRPEPQAHVRLHADMRCEHIMSRDVIHVRAGTSLSDTRALLRDSGARRVPVVDAQVRVLGHVDATDLLSDYGDSVDDVMSVAPYLTSADAPIDTLLPLFSGGSVHEAIVVDDQRRLVGIVTQTDMLAALWGEHAARVVIDNKARADEVLAG